MVFTLVRISLRGRRLPLKKTLMFYWYDIHSLGQSPICQLSLFPFLFLLFFFFPVFSFFLFLISHHTHSLLSSVCSLHLCFFLFLSSLFSSVLLSPFTHRSWPFSFFPRTNTRTLLKKTSLSLSSSFISSPCFQPTCFLISCW